MNALDTLARKLAALAKTDDVFEAGARTISVDGTPDPLTAILNEIDDTVLERTLEFKAGETTFALNVSGRRLRGVVFVQPAEKDTASVAGKVLMRDEPQVAQATLALLDSLCASAARVTVISKPPAPFGKGGDRGISAEGLSDLWQAQKPDVLQSPIPRFLTANAGGILAALHLNAGEVIATTGDVAALSTIWDTQVKAFRKMQRKHLSSTEGPQLFCFEGALGNGTAAALALAGDDIALVSYLPDDTGKLLSTWRAVTR